VCVCACVNVTSKHDSCAMTISENKGHDAHMYRRITSSSLNYRRTHFTTYL